MLQTFNYLKQQAQFKKQLFEQLKKLITQLIKQLVALEKKAKIIKKRNTQLASEEKKRPEEKSIFLMPLLIPYLDPEKVDFDSYDTYYNQAQAIYLDACEFAFENELTESLPWLVINMSQLTLLVFSLQPSELNEVTALMEKFIHQITLSFGFRLEPSPELEQIINATSISLNKEINAPTPSLFPSFRAPGIN